MKRLIYCCWVLLLAQVFAAPLAAQEASVLPIRVATFNVSLSRPQAGELARELREGSTQADQIAEIIQRVRPDVLLLNEFDYDPAGRAIDVFKSRYLAVGHAGCEGIEFGHHFAAAVNTGEPSGRDLDKDGRSDGPADAFGFGAFPGQYGMVVLSRFPIDRAAVRTFRRFLWRDMPQAALPVDPQTGAAYYSGTDLDVLRLSSKSHWDVPIRTPRGVFHFLVSHPTPPAFDGPEDRNGCRNYDEIRFWADYVTPGRSGFIQDDKGLAGGLGRGPFVIAGDLNADPEDGGSRPGAIDQLLQHARVSDRKPRSAGGPLQATRDGLANTMHKGDPALDTSNFSDKSVGNLRVDYVLPCSDHWFGKEGASGVFWPLPGQPGADLVGCSDHRLVWIDLGENKP